MCHDVCPLTTFKTNAEVESLRKMQATKDHQLEENYRVIDALKKQVEEVVHEKDKVIHQLEEKVQTLEQPVTVPPITVEDTPFEYTDSNEEMNSERKLKIQQLEKKLLSVYLELEKVRGNIL